MSAVPAPVRRGLRRALRTVVDAVPPLAHLRDERLLRARMRPALGYEPDLRNPRTYNERIAHKILYDRDPLLVRTADKIAVRDFVAERIGPEHLVPLIGTYAHAAEIPWDALPGRFVLKANHGSGTNLIVRDKSAQDRGAALRQAERWLAENHYAWTAEWAYGRIRPRLLVEEMLQGPDDEVPEDYKIYVFRGRPRLFEVHLGRFGPHYRYVHLDADTLGPVPFVWGEQAAPPEEQAAFVAPPEARRMMEIAASLGAGFDHVRVDLFLVGGRILFGELTHYTSNACAPFFPPDYDLVMGELWLDPARDWTAPRDGPAERAGQGRIAQGEGPAKLRVGHDPSKGTCVFAAAPIRAGELIGHCGGEATDRDTVHSIHLGGHRIEPDAPYRFLSHACEPNAEFRDRSRRLFAVRDIEEGAEVTIDYLHTEPVISAPFACRCGAAICRGMICTPANDRAPATRSA